MSFHNLRFQRYLFFSSCSSRGQVMATICLEKSEVSIHLRSTGLDFCTSYFHSIDETILISPSKLGILVSCYLDDWIFLTTTADDLRTNVNYALHLFDSLGFTINIQKSVLEPIQ